MAHRETNFGRHLKDDFKPYHNELVISTKAGYYMSPRPLRRMGLPQVPALQPRPVASRMRLDYVDIFYSHRPDPETPLEETMGALDHADHSGKALYAGISSYTPGADPRGDPVSRRWARRCSSATCRAQPLDRERFGPTSTTMPDQVGTGSIAFSPLAQGILAEHGFGTRCHRVTRRQGTVPVRISADRGKAEPGARFERHCRRTRPDGHRLDPARSAQGFACDLGACGRATWPSSRTPCAAIDDLARRSD